MKRIAVLGAMTVALALVAGPVLASNTGFKLNYTLMKGGKNLVSLPYFYYPDGNINAPAWDSATCTASPVGAACEDSEDVCKDLATGGCAVASVVRYVRTPAGALQANTWGCGGTFGQWAIKPGDAYFINVTNDPSCVADIVGSHNDDYSAGKGGSSKIKLMNGNNNVAVPYHVQAIDSEQLCQHITNDNPGVGLQAVVRINQSNGQATTWGCGTTFGMYPIVAGAGYFLQPKPVTPPATYDIQFRTY